MQVIEPTREENLSLNRFLENTPDLFEMIRAEREFLNALILRYKPRKLLEVGVSAGISSLIMLNAIKNDPEAKLYSIDLATQWYRDETKKTGFMTDHYPELTKGDKWKLLTGKLAFEQMEAIGDNIDFLLLDTAHRHPGELLDYLMILPFLKKNCPIVLHDINIQTFGFPTLEDQRPFTNNTLFSAFTGERIVLKDNMRYGMAGNTPLPNIGGVILADDARDHVYEVINALALPWNYMPDDDVLVNLRKFFARFYDDVSLDLFDRIVNYQQFSQKCNPLLKRAFRKQLRKKRYLFLAKISGGSLRKKFLAKADKYIQQEKYTDIIRSIRTEKVYHETLWGNSWRIFDKRIKDATESGKINVMDICFSTDDNYTHACGTAIASIKASRASGDRFRFHILDGGITPLNKKRLEKVAGNDPLFFHKIDHSLFKNCPIEKNSIYSLATYYRFLLPRLIPEAKRIIYLDGDLIVLDSLAPLWNHDMNGTSLSAVHDCCWEAFLPFVHRYHGDKEAERLGISDYVNAGVMLVDADQWRADHIEEKLFDYVKAPKVEIKIVDQDVINHVLAGSIDFLPPVWNYMTTEEYGLPVDDVRHNVIQAKIVHFTGGRKPWALDNCHPLRSLYEHYLKLTPWRFMLKAHRKHAIHKKITAFKSALKTMRRALVQYRWSREKKYIILFGFEIYRARQDDNTKK